MLNIKLNHSVKLISSSFGIEQNRADELSAIVAYNLINQQFLVSDLYDNPEDAPRELTTKTGVIEKCFEDAKNDNEMLFITWEFSKLDAMIEFSEEMASKFAMMSTSLFALSNRKKDRFISQYIKFKGLNVDED